MSNRPYSFAQYIAMNLSRIANLSKSQPDRAQGVLLALREYVHDRGPSGGGFDCGTELDIDKSSPAKLVFNTAYHHMNEAGYYDGWTHHVVVVTPAFDGIDTRVKGRNRNDIKDYIGETFHSWLSTVSASHPPLIEQQSA